MGKGRIYHEIKSRGHYLSTSKIISIIEKSGIKVNRAGRTISKEFTSEEVDQIILDNIDSKSASNIHYEFFEGSNISRSHLFWRFKFFKLCRPIIYCGDPECEVRYSRLIDGHRRKGETRRSRIASGELNVTYGIGRGRGCHLKINNRIIYVRSSYELVVALFFNFKKINFEYETVRIPYNGSITINDFLVGNNIIEVKGYVDSDLDNKMNQFKLNGFKTRIYTEKMINLMKSYLRRRNYPIDTYIDHLFKCDRNHISFIA